MVVPANSDRLITPLPSHALFIYLGRIKTGMLPTPSIIPPLLSGKERGGGWISHKLIVKLRVFGDPRYSGDYTTRITYPHCSIEEMQIVQEGQLSLPISELALLPPCTNPVVVKYKPRNTKALRQAIQQSLPLFGASAKLHFIATEKGYPTLSEQTLLAGTIEHWDSNQNKIINLPVAIVELLKEANASLEEQENAIALFQVAGANAALKYIEGLTTLRLLQQPTKGNRNQDVFTHNDGWNN